MDWSTIPSLAALRAFEAAARTGGFSAAARSLNVTPAAIAHHVRALEDDLGTALVSREGRRIAVTAAGQTLADGLAQGFDTISATINSLRSRAEDRPLSLAVTPAFAADWLMPRIGDFWSRHPDIQIAIHPSIALSDLRADDVDLAIRYGEGSWPGLESELLTDGEFWIVAHPSLIEGRPHETLADLHAFPWLLERYVLERKTLLCCSGIDLDDLELREMATNSIARSGAIAGLGISMLPRTLIQGEVASGNLKRLFALPDTALAYYMVTLPGRVSPRLKVLRRWLREQAAKEQDS